MKTLEYANQLVNEAFALNRQMRDAYLSAAIPLARGGALEDNDTTARLHRLSEKADKRYRRRFDARDDIRWPRRVEIRKKMASEAEKKAGRKRK